MSQTTTTTIITTTQMTTTTTTTKITHEAWDLRPLRLRIWEFSGMWRSAVCKKLSNRLLAVTSQET
jgi:hypothetical protein